MERAQRVLLWAVFFAFREDPQGGPVVQRHTTGLAPVDALTDRLELDGHRYHLSPPRGLSPWGDD
jgi:hypothetical protein